MNSKFSIIVIMAAFLPISADCASIYKCTKSDQKIIFTDKVCPANSATTLVHKETEREIQDRQHAEKLFTIKRLIEGNQPNVAKEYALKNGLSEYFYNQLSVYSNQKADDEKRRVEEEKQQQHEIEQQKLALQRQQLAVEAAKIQQPQQPNNPNYYGYGYPYYGGYYYGIPYRTPYYAPGYQRNTTFGANISGRIGSSTGFNLQLNSGRPFPHRHNHRGGERGR